MTKSASKPWTATALVTVLVSAMPAAGQVASPSVAALGMGDNFTAAARGYSAVAWNPAGLALNGNPGFSLTIGSARAVGGLGPISLGDLSRYEDTLVPESVKQQWLGSIRAAGGQSGTAGGDVTLLGVQVGPVALQLSTTARARSDISPGVAELILFGNADADGMPRTIDLTGSELDMNAYSTAAMSIGQAFALSGTGRLAVGVTARYTVGHFLATGSGGSGSTTADPIGVQFSFPLVHTDVDESDTSFDIDNGNGFGVDVGAGLESGVWTFAVAAHNVLNTFEWDQSTLLYRESRIVFNESTRETSFDSQPLDTAPAAVRERIEGNTFRPSFAGGTMMRYSEDLTLTADARFGSTDGMSTRAPTHVGAGIEYRIFNFLPVRIGAAFVQMDDNDTGVQFGGGIGLRLGAFNLAASAARRSTDLGSDNVVMFSLISIGQ